MDLQCLSVCVSRLINGSLPEAVFPPSPRCPPFIIHFSPQQKAARPGVGSRRRPPFICEELPRRDLYKPFRFCVSVGFCLFVCLVIWFLFFLSSLPITSYSLTVLIRFILPGFQHILRTQTLLWAQFLFHWHIRTKNENKYTRGAMSKPFFGSLLLQEWKINWDECRMLWIEPLGPGGYCYKPSFVNMGFNCACLKALDGREAQGWAGGQRDLPPGCIFRNLPTVHSPHGGHLVFFQRCKPDQPSLFENLWQLLDPLKRKSKHLHVATRLFKVWLHPPSNLIFPRLPSSSHWVSCLSGTLMTHGHLISPFRLSTDVDINPKLAIHMEQQTGSK